MTEEIDSETHSQTFGQAPGSLLRKGRKDCKSQGVGVRVITGKPTEKASLAHGNSGSENTTKVSVWDLPGPSLSDSCVVWLICGTADNGSRADSGALVGSWGHIALAELPYPA